MVSFHDHHSPEWMCLDRKPRPIGNECHGIACSEINIAFNMDLVEGKGIPTEGLHVSPEFELETGSKIASLCLRMKKSTCDSGRHFMLEIGFLHIEKVIELRKKGLFNTTFAKKKTFWPKHAKAQDMMDETQGKEVDTERIRKGTSINGSNSNDLHLVALEDSKH